MRALVQRVKHARVSVKGREISSIGEGMVILLGVAGGDNEKHADRLAQKVATLRIFPDEEGKMNEALGAREVLCVSQFTLYGDTDRGNRPSFVRAAKPQAAQPLYDRFCDALGAKRGEFGATMEVELLNDGPVTLLLDV